MLDINNLIKTSMKSGDKISLEAYKLIKAKMLEFKTQKNAPVYDDAAEISLLRKMVKEREESFRIYSENGRMDLADKEKSEIDVILPLIPKEPSDEDINNFINNSHPDGFDKKIMGLVIKEIKTAFPTADGSKIAAIVKSKL